MHRSSLLTWLALCLFCLPGPALGLVDPEVEAWEKIVSDARQVLTMPGGDLFATALEQVGATGSNLARAPLADLMSELELRRGLKFKYFTPWHVKDKSELRKFIARQLDKEYTPEKIESEVSLLKALRLVPSDFELLPFLENLYTDQVAGAYDPETDQFFLVDAAGGQSIRKRLVQKATTMMMDTRSVITIHELDHALGGQHFPLKSIFESLIKGWSLDRQMAAAALVEGDATFVMIDHQRRTPPAEQGEKTVLLGMDMMTDMLTSLADWNLPGMGLDGFSDAPLFYQKSLIFPYYGGAEFVSHLRHSGTDWTRVNQAYDLEAMPESTEQVFHPNRYLYLQAEPDHPDFTSLPNTIGPWKKVTDDTGGEFLIRIVLEQHGVESYLSGADGWHGDRIRVFRHSQSGKLGFYWVIRWDWEEEAEEFLQLAKSLPFQVTGSGKTSDLSSGLSEAELKKLRVKLR